MLPSDFEDIPFIKNASPEVRREILRSAIWYCVPGGLPLFLTGESADMMWFVRSGSFGTFCEHLDGTLELIGHIRSGEPIGEMAIIAGQKHSLSVYSLRDSEVIGIHRQVFQRLIRKHAEIMEIFAKVIMNRSLQTRKNIQSANPKVYSLFAASPNINIETRANLIAEEIQKLGRKVIVLTDKNAIFDTKRFEEVEKSHDIILLAANLGKGLWQQTCLRQADRIWIFGRTDAVPSNPLLPEGTFFSEKFALVDIILVRELGNRQISTATQWLEAAKANRVLPWRKHMEEDLKSLARIITGKSVGLVLSGGGARAYAHIGVVRALREAQYDFDFLCGTSMGGVIAACVAMGWSDTEIEKRIWDGFVKSDPLSDYIIPVVSISSGKKVDTRLERHFGDMLIEDLKRPFFCVSSNLSLSRVKIHRSGILRNALRASIALPGILPPVVENDEVLVDGAVFDNMPIDILKSYHRGINIGVDVANRHELNSDEFKQPVNVVKWINNKKFKAPPPIAELLMSAATANIANNTNAVIPDILISPHMANINLRDWKKFDEAVEAGYNATVKYLTENDSLQKIY